MQVILWFMQVIFWFMQVILWFMQVIFRFMQVICLIATCRPRPVVPTRAVVKNSYVVAEHLLFGTAKFFQLEIQSDVTK
jgi:hypothetical protein